ncbi:gliding motility-associated C-terminal domain-containing protein [Flavobacterium sp. KACC 22763]|uniref:T9SS type B sorting domain-containing protein n=1 Tax=Flavobacterium sp. KACC 22763 TaxID=3025668 RepID=UPI002365C098|nr:gliding motility-associated C-terminal domain-containing protein [Flavobacterium sp. KACC 22763]WDF64130.1 gliding motility-associated C-terminal domain-containing protein [Flavobacterium sp. KACC 22763]
MRNSTFCKSGFSRLIFLIVFLLLTVHSASAQFYTKHYIAPAPWQYFSNANEIIIATNSTTAVTFTITKSDGSTVAFTKPDGTATGALTTVKGAPAVYRFVGNPNSAPLGYNVAGTVYNDRGIIVTSTGGAVSVNLRNVASDALGNGGDNYIKGNASLTSFGDAGIGVEFRVGYYRNMGTSDRERPFYSVMAIGNNTQVKVNGSVVTTLGAGQSYLFNAAIGSLVESSGPIVMNTGVRIDTPEACGDGTFDQLPPVSVLGKEYFLERGKGNDTAEQTTVVATKDGTTITINTYNATTGNEVGSPVTVSRNAGEYYTFKNGVSGTQFTSSRISATNNVAVYSGTADGCEVDVSTIAPVSACGGSVFVETSTFKGYNNASLDYFGYVLLQSKTAAVFINSANLETTTGTSRRQLGSTGWYIIDFNRTQIGNPNTISLSSSAKLTVSIAQQGDGYSMAAFFSNFAQQPSAPKETYIGTAGCLKQSAKLTTDPGFSPYEWRYNGTVIPGETSNTITVTKTGSYTVTSTLSCGISSQSTPINVTLCSDVAVENTVNVSSQCVGSNVVFTLTAKNLGPSNAEGVSVTDKLPSGYTYVSSVPSTGTSYDSSTGIWTISSLDSGASTALTITATVKDTGTYSNTATITSSNVDDPSGNNTATASTTPNALPVAATLATNTPVCSGSNAIFTISGTSGNTVTYTGAASGTATIGSDGKATVTVPNVTANSTLNLTNVSNGICSRTLTVSATVTVNSLPTTPTISAAATGTTFCSGGSVVLTSSAGSGNQWYKDGVAIPSATNKTYSATASGSYTVTTNNGTCTSAASTGTVVTVNSLPVALSLTGSTICVSPGGNGTISSSTSASGVNYQLYDSSNTAIQSVKSGNGSALEWSNLSSANGYYVIATNASNCTSKSNVVNITTNPNPTISIGGTLTACLTTTLTTTTNANSPTYVWYKNNVLISGETSSSLVVNSDGDYKVKVRNTVTGCEQTSAVSTVKVSDTEKPVKPTLADITGQCSVTVTAPTTTDNCTGTVTGTTTDPLTYNAQGTYTINWSFNDGNGNVETATQKVIIKDTQKPAKPVLADITGECSATATAPTTTDNCKGTVTGTTSDPLTYNAQGTYTINWTFNDGNGNVETAAQKVIIKDIQKPVKPVLADITGECSATVTAPTTTDNCKGTVTGTTTDPLTYNAQGTYTINWSFNDGNGNVETATQKVIIKDTQKPAKPVLADITGECSATATAPTTTDNCAGTVTGTTTDPLTYNAQGTYTINWTFNDGNGNVETATQKVIVKDTQKPAKPVLADITGECSATVTAPTTTDNCKGTVTGTTTDPLTYNAQGTYTINWTFNDGNGNLETATQKVIIKDTQKPAKPVLADITGECSATATAPTTTDNCKGTVTGTTSDPLTYNAQGTYTINWTFNDGNGNVETATQKVIIKDTQKPAKPVLADITGECSATATAPTTTDSCAGTVTGTTTDPLTYNAQGIYTINWSFNDGNGNTETAVQKVIIKDTQKPVQPTLADVTGECSATATAPTTTDNCAGTVTGTTADPLTYNAQGTYTINWTFNDGNGNVETVAQKVIIKDTQKPVQPTLADVTGECSATATAPTTTDNCAGTVTGTTTDPLTYNAQGTYTINWSFNDGNGNIETAIQNVIIKDTQKPSITCPSVVSVSADANSCSATGVALGTPTVSDNCTGTVTVTNDAPSSFPIGNTTVTWRAKDAAGNTETCTQIVKVIGEIISNDDSISSSNGVAGGVVITNVFDNDVLNCNKVNIAQVDVVVNGTVPSVLTFNTANGAVSVKPNTPTGTYTFDYSICEIANSGNCDSATVTIKIENGLVAVKDDFGTKSSGSTSATIGNVKTNDTLDGVFVTSGNTVVTADSSGPLSVDANGDVTLAANTPSGTYSITYEICEKGANPANCKTTTAEVKVVNDLIAVKDDFGTKSSGSTAAIVGNVKSNDTLDGAFVTSGNTVVTADSSGPLSVDANGDVTLAANTPSGTYSITYEICEKDANPSNCKTATAEIKIVNTIDAVLDTITPINGNIGGTTISLVENDTLNGNKVVVGTSSGEVAINIVGTLPSGLTLNASGTITVAPNTPKGNYNIEYRICEIGAVPANCDSVTITVPVTAGNLVANADEIPSVLGSNVPQTLGKNVFDNDTKNGQPLNPSDVTLKTTVADPKGYLTVDTDGNIVLGANPPAGNYELTYEICEKLNLDNCSSNTVKVTVGTPIIDAVADTVSAINGNIGGKTISLIANDKLNGSPITVGTAAGEVKFEISGTLPTGLTLNSDYTITVAPNTPKGNYNIEYKICENTNPTNCDSVTITVPVTAGNLVANADEIPSVLGSNVPQTLGKNVFDNDTKNGQPLNPSDVTLKTTVADPKGYLTVDTDGNIVLGANPPAGDYELTYEICEKLNLDNCSANTVKVTVATPVIDAVADVISSINGNIGGTTISLIANDKLNGNAIVVGTGAGEVKFEIIGTLPSGLTLNSDYAITVAPNTPAGDYNVEYKICENTNPTNCDSVITVVKVTGGNLVANEDLVPSAVGVNIPQKVINVFENDTKNGNPLVPSDVDLKVTQADPKGYLTIDADGNVVLVPNAPAGEYELTYTICEKLNPNNCDSNIVKVTVAEPKMNVTASSYCSNNVPYVNYTVTPENFTAHNLLTVRWIDSNNNVVATQTNLPLSGNILWPGAEVDSNGNGTDWPGWILNNGIWSEGADGFEATRNGVKMEFSLNPTVTVSVAYPPATPDCNARPTFSIKANNDEAGPVNAKKGVNANVNIFENDLLNGAKIKASDVVLSVPVVHPNISLNADGSINIAANTPDGIYELTYQICEATNASNCSQAVIKITVDNVVDPTPPTENKITLNSDNDISADGINGSLEFVNVLDNDLINGQPINPADVIIKPVTESPYFEWNADGTVNIKPNTPGGNYPLTYQVCEKANGINCSTAVLNVFVEVPAISVIKTAVFNDENKSGFANAGETITYKFTVTNTGNVPLVGITINDPLPGVVVSGQAINLGVNESNETNFTAVYKITQEDINRGSVSNQATVKGSSVRGVVVEDQSDDASNSGDSPTVLDLNGCSIKVMNAFSPNGDNKNARFYIRGIECYPDNTVEIYNRWGVLVFNIEQYNNNDRVFVGYSNGRSTIKQTDGLPVGTYFYVLKYKDSTQKSHQESGYLYLNK